MKATFSIASVFVIILALGSCGEKAPEKNLIKAQKDSVLAESELPGAGVVGKAIEAADSSAARAKRLDKQTDTR